MKLEIVNKTKQPVFLTENGVVIMSIETYEKMCFENEIYSKLLEAEHEAVVTNKRYSSKEVLIAAKKAICK